MIVVDSNVVAYLYLPGDSTAAAEALHARDPDWAAPVLWRSEFRKILAGYLRRNSLTFDQCLAMQAEAESLMSGGEYETDSRSILQLVRDSDCSAYDCEYIALATRLNTRLITMDKKLLKTFPDRAIALNAV